MTPEELNGIFWQWIKLIFFAWVIGSIGGAVIKNAFSIGVDDTDASSWGRSGMKIYTDHKTGVQYLGAERGGLTVRIDRDGRPMVREAEAVTK